MIQRLLLMLLLFGPLAAEGLEERLSQAIIDCLLPLLDAGEDSLALDWTMPALKSSLPDDLLVSTELRQLRQRGTSVIRIRLHDESRTLKSITLPVRVKRWRWLPVAAKDLAHGHILDFEDLVLKQIDITEMRDTDLPGMETVIGQQLCRYLTAGRPVHGRMIRQLPDLKRGDDLTVIVSSGAVRIEARGQALEEAHTGDEFLVRMEPTGKRLRAVLLESGKALVEAGG